MRFLSKIVLMDDSVKARLPGEELAHDASGVSLILRRDNLGGLFGGLFAVELTATC
jgi:hypothetical protein